MSRLSMHFHDRAFVAALVCILLTAACAQPVPTPAPVAVAPTPLAEWPPVIGCWELRMDAWQPTLMLGADERIITPPSRVLIDSAIGTRPYERRNMLLRPAPGAAPSVHRYSWWNLGRGDSVQLRWTTGFSGVNMSLALARDTLRGYANTQWDFQRTPQQAEVTGWRVPCDQGPILAGDSLQRNIPFSPSMHVAERGSLRHFDGGQAVAREWWELVRGGDTLAIVARVESAASVRPHIVTLRTDSSYVPQLLDVDGSEDAAIRVMGARTRIGTGSGATTIQTPTAYFLLPESPAVAPWGALLRRWERAKRPATLDILGRSEIRVSWRGRDSVLIGSQRMILERIEAAGDDFGRRTLWTDTIGGLVASLGGKRGAFAIREGYEAAMPWLLTSARADALRVLRAALDDVRPARTASFAIVGATVLDGVRERPLPNAVVLVEDGRIADIGTRAAVKLPKGVPVIQGRGLTVIPGAYAEGWSVSDYGWGPGALAQGIVGVRLAAQSDTVMNIIRETLDREGGLAPRLLPASDSTRLRVLREGAPADFVVVEGVRRSIPDKPTRVRWVSLGGRLYAASALRKSS